MNETTQEPTQETYRCHWCGEEINEREEPCCDAYVECQQRMKEQLERAAAENVRLRYEVVAWAQWAKVGPSILREFVRNRPDLQPHIEDFLAHDAFRYGIGTCNEPDEESETEERCGVVFSLPADPDQITRCPACGSVAIIEVRNPAHQGTARQGRLF